MSSRTLRLAFPLLLLGLLLPTDARAAEIVKDGSFESTPASEDNPNWEDSSLMFGTPICDTDNCEQGATPGGGLTTVGPRTGKAWVWFGGSAGPEQGSVAQSVTIPPGPATLTFYLWLGNSSGNGLDTLSVFLGTTNIFELSEASTEYGSYKLVTVDVGAFAGTGAQDLSFEFEAFGGGTTNISLDDISLQAGQSGGGSITLKGPKRVAKGKRAQLTVSVQPCADHAGESVDLFRGKKKVGTQVADAACVAKFKVKIKRTSTFRAVSPAGTSNKLKIRVRKKS